jgi:hypothetical protein
MISSLTRAHSQLLSIIKEFVEKKNEGKKNWNLEKKQYLTISPPKKKSQNYI